MNSAEQDPDKKWVTTWNDNLPLILNAAGSKGMPTAKLLDE
jgi:hypothetical protein